MASDRKQYPDRREDKRAQACAERLATPQACEHCDEPFYCERKRKYCDSGECERSRSAAKSRKLRANWSDEKRAAVNARHKDSTAGKPRRRPRVCEVCNDDYTPTYKDQRTCGRECGAELQKQNKLEALVGDREPVPWASCAVCRTLFIARKKRPHCKPQRLASVYVPIEYEPKPCEECGSEFVPKSSLHKYCKASCGKRALRRHNRHKDRVALASVERTDGRIGSWDEIYTDCQECGNELTGRRRKWCTDACRKRAYDRHERHLARTAPSCSLDEPVFTTWQIAERDGWRCHICGKKVASLDNASLDHLIPVVDGGLHTPINVALAHFDCNTQRGSSGVAQLMLMSL